MKNRGWRTNPVTYPGFVARAVRRGLKLATTINIEEANDKTWLVITFKKLPKAKSATPDPARLTPLDEGKASGSATDPSSPLRL